MSKAAFRAYLKCGILAHGFARVHCGGCGHQFLVAFSCKGRDVCPSCASRRMVETAAHLIDHVLPRVPYRQWVLSVPKRVRWHMRAKPEVTSGLLRVFLGAVETSATGIVVLDPEVPVPAELPGRACLGVLLQLGIALTEVETFCSLAACIDGSTPRPRHRTPIHHPAVDE